MTKSESDPETRVYVSNSGGFLCVKKGPRITSPQRQHSNNSKFVSFTCFHDAMDACQGVGSDFSPVQARVSCEPCRDKKVRCTGERPVCSRCKSKSRQCVYSAQLPTGRPKTAVRRRTRARPYLHREDRILPSEEASDTIVDVSFTAQSTPTDPCEASQAPRPPGVPDVQTAQNPGNIAPPYVVDLENHPRTRESQSVYPSLLANEAKPSSCACLSIMYLMMEQLRGQDQFTVPDDLTILRNCLNSARQVLDCTHCPLRYLSIVQNATILGALCLCLAECYARALDWIDGEAKRANSAKQQKRLSVLASSPDVIHGPSLTVTMPASFAVEVAPSEWRNMMRNIVKAELFGTESRKQDCFSSFISALEDRQRSWHRTPPAPDCPPMYRSPCNVDDPLPTCLSIVNEAKKLIYRIENN
ncbi:uncharacterized protein TRUGW13939_00923 [Talaromyces rugulosus]|uniref:Zn(2)-C6 fungal-type domain-containing protein n=1 Tax=Talaromyces rugulosus TaxID=121627 RepID=A0A7H8QKV1_TALRU|nr:uncharacterized protein TRUGW13939_00923 [Talaromyces rugulosus]QKX53843.1 hypothetical protein TRUGW13939_00923 [Talaromyces rugulosus]